MAERHLPALLVIMDGCGLAPEGADNAVAAAETPFLDHLYATYPHTTLGAFGEDVGLPDGQMGNSEVGHLNIGAGRIVFQSCPGINNAISDGSMKSAMDDVAKSGAPAPRTSPGRRSAAPRRELPPVAPSTAWSTSASTASWTGATSTRTPARATSRRSRRTSTR